MNEYYYISDMHMDENLSLCCGSIEEEYGEIAMRVDELIESVGEDTFGKTLLIAGDSADSAVFESRFYSILHGMWNGRIIAVLGNHELWHDDPVALTREFTIDEIYDDYRSRCGMFAKILENELLLINDELGERRLDYERIIKMDNEELREMVSKADMAILGGTGYAALSKGFTAASGMYMDSVSIPQEKYRTKVWRSLHDKVRRACGDMPIVVLTHMPYSDWMDDEPNPNWRYVSGHTHSNRKHKVGNEVVGYADNQIGNGWGKWKLKKFEF